MVYLLATECGFSFEYIMGLSPIQIHSYFEGKSRNIDRKDGKGGQVTGKKGSGGDSIQQLMSLLGSTKVKMSPKAKVKIDEINRRKMENA